MVACTRFASMRGPAPCSKVDGDGQRELRVMLVLLVDVDQTLNLSLATQLEKAGYAVDRAEDGREGLYYAQEYPIDLAIVDLGLPTISGVELIKQVRAGGKAYPILVLTARDR